MLQPKYRPTLDRFVPRGSLANLVTSPKKHHSVATANDGDGMRFEVRSGEQWLADVGRSIFYERSEIAWAQAFAQGQDIWVAFDQRISIDALPIVATEAGGYQCFCYQWHTVDTATIGVSPFLAGNILANGSWAVLYRGSTTGGGNPQTPYTDNNFQFGRWYRHVIHLKPSGGAASGVVQWWRDGVKIVDVSGVPLSFPDDTAPYPKFGIYRTGMKNTMVVEYRSVKVGTTPIAPV